MESPRLTTLTPLEQELIDDFMEEIEAVIEADDGTLVPTKLLEKYYQLKEVLYGA